MIPGRLQPDPRLHHRFLLHLYGGMFAFANWATEMDFWGGKSRLCHSSFPQKETISDIRLMSSSLGRSDLIMRNYRLTPAVTATIYDLKKVPSYFEATAEVI